VDLSRGWAESLMTRMGYVKRKGTKAARKLPDDFAEQKETILNRISNVVRENSIPEDLIINFDQTGLNIVPVSGWTLHDCGAKQVEITGLDDKRQITAVLGVSLSGNLLPLQLLYLGTTSICHPKYKFPDNFHIWHSANHWSNVSTMEEYVDKILVPYFSAQKEHLGLGEDQKALAIFDVFKAHRADAVQELLTKHNICMVYVPAGCTGELQPLDVSGNKEFKDHLKSSFTPWYADKVAVSLETNTPMGKIDLKLSTIKPLHAK
jgi:hypothetical protein